MTTAELAVSLIRAAARHSGASPRLIISKDRSTPTVEARWACWLVMRDHGLTVAEIGSAFSRDHTSVCHGLERSKHHQGKREESFRDLCDFVKNHHQTKTHQ